MTGRDDLLRGHVIRAFQLRGTSAYTGACADVVDGWMLYPAIEAELALQRVRRAEADAIAAADEAEIGWYRSCGIDVDEPADGRELAA